ncbi:beta-lactamase-like protein [Plectosphaerella plurivora]|uniref:Beta-lactamase-like protein n=1 Tax=Plectosphaerella plurivora TaxID=936078 RepID=A0A9P8V6L9_9PEZI|nr:beta-lactamase-like protein [Plectosphaerella plurivora]
MSQTSFLLDATPTGTPPDLLPPPHPDDAVVTVRAIDTTTHLVCDATAFVQPPIAGHDRLSMRTLCFLLEHHRPGHAKPELVLFDCGARKDYWAGSPQTCRMIGGHVPSLEVDAGVDEILSRGGVDPGDLRAVIWSHWHWDHIGDGSKFPSHVDIVVGPGFTEAFAPGYPERPESFVLKSDLDGHRLDEIAFETTAGGFPAHDYFGDGSFYLLDVPGHALGHICGLARTTADSYVFLGGDCCHFPGVFRPTPSRPLPETIPSSILDSSPSPCPSSVFTRIHPLASTADKNADWEAQARSTPFYQVSRNPGSAYTDGDLAQRSVDKLRPLDADPRVLVCLAHDNKLAILFPLFNNDPTASINDWKSQGYDDAARWDFLNDLPYEGARPRPPLVDGLRRDGRRIAWTAEGGFQDM